MLATLFLLIITLAGMAVVVANALHNSPWGFFSVFATIPIAIFICIYLKWLRPGKIQEATIIGVALIFAAIIYGPNVAASEYASWFTYDLQTHRNHACRVWFLCSSIASLVIACSS